MSKVNRIEVAGFRGILSRLEIPLNGKSMILYGRNGTGKSSLTDAWEWLTVGKVAHLAREGAHESSYPHMNAQPGTTYAQVEFANPALGKVRLTFNEKKLRTPTAVGKLTELRKLVSHPCHVRHADLTNFVLLQKSARYDALASLMGFVPQMEYQKALRRLEEALKRDFDIHIQLYKETSRKHTAHFTNKPGETFSPLQLLAKRCTGHGFECEPTMDRIRAASAFLKQAVVNDVNAKKLAAIRAIRTSADVLVPPFGVSGKIKALSEAIGNLKAAQSAEREKLLLIPLLVAAEKIVAKIPSSGNCPLCNQQYDGDLKQHVTGELATLQRLNTLLTQVRTTKEALRMGLVDHCTYTPIEVPEGYDPPQPFKEAIAAFESSAEVMKAAVATARDLLTFDTSDLSDDLVVSFKLAEGLTDQAARNFQAGKRTLTEVADDLVKTLETDPLRKRLVDDHEFLVAGMELIEDLEVAKQKGVRMRALSNKVTPMVQRYVDMVLTDVNDRFDQISGKVTDFFAVLEKGTPGLGAPRLKLEPGHDRSVVLEVEFHGTPINPAYRYLSESQLNSFGLAVALASATHFNKDFPFLILDDVVNSCDAYKRPQLIELLKTQLSQVQVLLMTHDRFWRDLLHKRLPSWGKMDFHRYVPGVGPICEAGKNFYQRVQDELNRDEAENAAGALARYLEDAAQELCESFQVEMKFNRRGEYTLDPLLNGIRSRLEKKLGGNHPVVQEITRVTQDNAYRNWGIHCKNPESPITSLEIGIVVANWQALEAKFYCVTCSGVLSWNEPDFRCGCGSSVLKKEVPVATPRGAHASPATPRTASSAGGSAKSPHTGGLS